MVKRLQVLLDEGELREVQRAARRERLTTAEWVRRAIRMARRARPVNESGRKLAAVRAGARHAFPAPDIEQKLAEIERGYTGDARE